MYRLEQCINSNDISTEKGIDDCVPSFVRELNEIMSDFHKCPVANNIDTHNKKRGSIDNGGSHNPWFDGACINLYKTYRKSLYNFNVCKSTENHRILQRCKKEYKDTEIKLKKRDLREKSNMLEYMKKNNPKKFYSHFAKKKSVKADVPIQDFLRHFKSVSGTGASDSTDTGDAPDENDVIFEELDNEITRDEIVKAIKGLKRNKSHGTDGILNEYFIECADTSSYCHYYIQFSMLFTVQVVSPKFCVMLLLFPFTKR